IAAVAVEPALLLYEVEEEHARQGGEREGVPVGAAPWPSEAIGEALEHGAEGAEESRRDALGAERLADPDAQRQRRFVGPGGEPPGGAAGAERCGGPGPGRSRRRPQPGPGWHGFPRRVVTEHADHLAEIVNLLGAGEKRPQHPEPLDCRGAQGAARCSNHCYRNVAGRTGTMRYVLFLSLILPLTVPRSRWRPPLP